MTRVSNNNDMFESCLIINMYKCAPMGLTEQHGLFLRFPCIMRITYLSLNTYQMLTDQQYKMYQSTSEL